jgi:uncharacterized protein with PQ loop repeat
MDLMIFTNPPGMEEKHTSDFNRPGEYRSIVIIHVAEKIYHVYVLRPLVIAKYITSFRNNEILRYRPTLLCDHLTLTLGLIILFEKKSEMDKSHENKFLGKLWPNNFVQDQNSQLIA